MRSLINLSLGRGGDSQWTITEQPGGDLTLIDVDSEPGQALLESMNERGSRIIAFTRDRDSSFPVRLGKPLRSREFLSLLQKLIEGGWPGADAPAEDAEDAGVGNATGPSGEHGTRRDRAETMASGPGRSSDSGAGTNQRWKTMQAETASGSRTLAEHLRRNVWRKPGVLTHPGWPLLVIDPGSGAWFFDGTITDLEPQQFAELIPESAVVPISNDELVERIQGHRQRPLSELKWFAGLAQSRGQLHPDLVGEVQFMLTQVPTEAMKSEALHALARLLIRGPMTVDALLEESGHSRENVSAFLNACYTSNKLLLNRLAQVSSF